MVDHEEQQILRRADEAKLVEPRREAKEQGQRELDELAASETPVETPPEDGDNNSGDQG